MCIVMFKANIIRPGRFKNEWLIHKFVRPYLQAVEIQTEDNESIAENGRGYT